MKIRKKVNLNILVITLFILLSSGSFTKNPQSDIKIPDFKKSSQNFEQKFRAWETAMADLDSDGDLDAVITSLGPATDVLFNDGKGYFKASGQKLSTAAYGFIGTGDLNNDGFIDIIISGRENPATIWMNNGKGKFIDSGITLGEGGDWNNCIIKDIDNDGDMDVFITKVLGGSHGLWLNQLIPEKNKLFPE